MVHRGHKLSKIRTPHRRLVRRLEVLQRRGGGGLGARVVAEHRAACTNHTKFVAARVLRRTEAQLWAESAVLTGMEARLRRRVGCHGRYI